MPEALLGRENSMSKRCSRLTNTRPELPDKYARRTACWPRNSSSVAFPFILSRTPSCWPQLAASSVLPRLRR